MLRFFKKVLFWIVLIVLVIALVLFINTRIESNKNGKKKEEKSENNPRQNPPKPPNNDNPPDNPEPSPIDTENWWLGDEEIEHAYSEIRKEISDSPEIQLVSPNVVRIIQAGGEISEDLKKAKIIFFPINSPKQHEPVGAGTHWNLLVFFGGKLGVFENYNSLEFTFTPENAMKVAKKFYEKTNLAAWPHVENVKEIPHQTNGADCGLFVIAFTRVLIKNYKKSEEDNGSIKMNIDQEDLIFTIAEERQKLKAAGFPKK